MQYEVHPTQQTRDIDPTVNGSFKNFTLFTKNSVKNQEKFSRTCGFRSNFTESLNFHFKPSNIPNQWLHFRQNPLKVEKLFLALYRNYWMIQNFPGQTAVCVSYSYCAEPSCQKAKKSCARFFRKSGNQLPTNYQQLQAWPQLTLRIVTLGTSGLNVRI